MAEDTDDDEIAALQERLRLARRALAEAYDKRDSLLEDVVARSRSGDMVRSELLVALSTAERAVLAAETEMKDAEYALGVAVTGIAERRQP